MASFMLQEYLAVSLLVGWLVATGVYQCFLGRMRPWVHRYDLFRLLPEWNYFRARPMQIEFECRFESSNRSTSSWHPAGNFASRSMLTAIWNPEFVVPGVIMGWSEQVAKHVADSERTDAIEDYFPHRGLIHSLKALAPPATTRGQFRIIQHSIIGNEDRVLFTSQWQVLSAGQLQFMRTNGPTIDTAILEANLQSQSLRKAG